MPARIYGYTFFSNLIKNLRRIVELDSVFSFEMACPISASVMLYFIYLNLYFPCKTEIRCVLRIVPSCLFLSLGGRVGLDNAACFIEREIW